MKAGVESKGIPLARNFSAYDFVFMKTAQAPPSTFGLMETSLRKRSGRKVMRTRFLESTVLTVILCASFQTGHAQLGQRLDLPMSSFSACDFCLAAQGISPLEAGASGLRADFRYLTLGSMYRGGSRVANSDGEVESHFTQQYTLLFQLGRVWTISGIIPFARRHTEFTAEGGNVVNGNQFGLGDIAVLARYKAIMTHGMESTYMLSLNAGVKTPTGRTNGYDSQGNLLDAHIQLGTGSTDFLVGCSGIAAFDRAALIANVLTSITTQGAHGHRFGNSVNYDLSLRYRLFPEGYEGVQFFGVVGLTGEWRGREIQDGTPDENSGGNVAYISPGAQVFFTPSVSVEAAFQYPVVHALHGEQLGEDFRIMTGIQLLFR